MKSCSPNSSVGSGCSGTGTGTDLGMDWGAKVILNSDEEVAEDMIVLRWRRRWRRKERERERAGEERERRREDRAAAAAIVAAIAAIVW